tara:strand:+ start:539 stop:1420 length:882 start_codon:yes stop_codon:yes gene_type:complete
MLNLAQVETFVAVVEQGGFHEAARHLGVSQPTVTQHIKKLEADLVRPLIVRAHGSAGTTSHGAAFLPFARTLLRIAGRARAALDSRGLVIGASSNIGVYLLQPLVKAFAEALPDFGPVDLRIAGNPDIARRLEDSEVDIGLMEWWDDRPGFEAQVWREEPVVVIVPPDHPWAGRASVDKAELLAEPLIGGEPGTGTARLLERELGIAPEALKAGPQLGSTEAVKQAVRAGLGVSLTLESAVRDETASGALHALSVRERPLAKSLYAILADNLPAASPARAFGEFLRPAAPAGV